MTTAIDVLKAGFNLSHMLFGMTTSDLTSETAAARLPGATINAILPIYAPAVFGEDMMVSQVAGTETLLVSGGWRERTGIPGPSPMQDDAWGAATYNLEQLRAYTEAVFAQTSQFLDRVTEAELSKEIPSPIGGNMVKAGEFLASFGTVHINAHCGEIAALKGVQGGKGLPF